MYIKKFLFGLCVAISFGISYTSEQFEVEFEWNYINFTWRSSEELELSKKTDRYVPGADIIAGIKIYKGVIYLALPRIKPDARITLASLPTSARSNNPLLTPYPSWELNSGTSCDTIQNVLSMEIDKDGIMWLLDARRVDGNTNCPPKIILLDLNNNGTFVKSFIVPDELCPHKTCFLNDIVVDGDYAYISDTTQSDPGIFVYNRRLDQAWKVRHKSMFGDPTATNFTAQGETLTGLQHINGIALSPYCEENRTLYYMPQTSLNIYSISNSVLKNETLAKSNDVGLYIKDNGKKQAQSGGMMSDDRGNIYYGLLPLDAVGKWNTSKPISEAVILDENHEIIKWPDSFAFCENGNLRLITNSILRFSRRGIDINEINFRILKLHTGTFAYHFCNRML